MTLKTDLQLAQPPARKNAAPATLPDASRPLSRLDTPASPEVCEDLARWESEGGAIHSAPARERDQ